MPAFDPTRPCVDLLPGRRASIPGAGLTWWAADRVLRLLVGGKRDDRRYAVRELAVDRGHFRGRGFALDKLTACSDAEADGYAILVSDLGERHDSCECRGFLRHGHCSHLDAVRTVLANGWWDLPPHPCAGDEYAAFSAAVDAGYPDDEPDWVREGGIGERADVPF